MTVEIIEPGSILVLILACPGIDLDLLKQTQTFRLGTIAAIVVFVGATDFFINLNRLHGLKHERW